MRDLVAIFAGGVLFGVGLAVSGLAHQEAVLAFLHLDDLGLALVMAAAIGVAMPFYQWLPRGGRRPLLGGTFEKMAGAVSKHHIAGGILFGVGWGVSGVCPGAALASFGLGNWPMFAGFGGMLLGAYLQGWLAEASSVSSAPTPSAGSS